MKRPSKPLERIKASPQRFVIGIDEVGFGAWAGPLMVCAAVVPASWGPPEVKDSKTFGRDVIRRARVAAKLIAEIPYFELVVAEPQEIDSCGLGEVNRISFLVAASRCLKLFEDSIVVADGVMDLYGVQGTWYSLPKADELVPAVSAASIIAKDARDRMMRELHEIWPSYGFSRHVGYGTAEHKAALSQFGVCPVHRKSYKSAKEGLIRAAKLRRSATRLAWPPLQRETPG